MLGVSIVKRMSVGIRSASGNSSARARGPTIGVKGPRKYLHRHKVLAYPWPAAKGNGNSNFQLPNEGHIVWAVAGVNINAI